MTIFCTTNYGLDSLKRRFGGKEARREGALSGKDMRFVRKVSVGRSFLTSDNARIRFHIAISLVKSGRRSEKDAARCNCEETNDVLARRS